MEIIKQGENTIYSFELHQAQSKLDCGISLENFLKHRAEKFEFGKDAYCDMVKHEIEYINQNTEDFVDFDILGRPFWTLDNISLEVAKKIIDDIQSDKPKTNQLQTKLNDSQRGKLFDLLVLHGFIPKTDKEGFIWAFGGVNGNYTSYSTDWLKKDNLAVYLVDCLCYDKNVKIQDSYLNRAGKIFGIKHPRQSKKGYENNKNGTPDGYELIDKIILEAQK